MDYNATINLLPPEATEPLTDPMNVRWALFLEDHPDGPGLSPGLMEQAIVKIAENIINNQLDHSLPPNPAGMPLVYCNVLTIGNPQDLAEMRALGEEMRSEWASWDEDEAAWEAMTPRQRALETEAVDSKITALMATELINRLQIIVDAKGDLPVTDNAFYSAFEVEWLPIEEDGDQELIRIEFGTP